MRHLAGKQVAVLLTLAGIVRLGAAAYWQEHWPAQFVFGDSYGYFQLGGTIARGQPYELPGGERVFRTPGYPLLLAPVLWFFSGPRAILAARLENCCFGTLTALAVAWWAGILFGQRAAWIAGLIAAFYPEAVAISVPVLSEAPFDLLVATNLAVWTLAWKHAGWHVPELAKGVFAIRPRPSQAQGRGTRDAIIYALATGAIAAVAAVAAVVRPSWMLFVPFAAACGVFWRPRGRQLLFAVAMFAGFAVVMMPWWIRNYRVTGHFVPTTLQVGASLYDGLNPHATGASDMRFVPEFEAALRKSDTENAAHGPSADSFEYRLDQRLRDAAWGWARTHPGRAVQLAGIKFLRLWNVWPNEPAFSSWPVRGAVLVTYAPLMVLALLGAWHARRLGFPAALCWLPAVYFTLLHTVFVSSIRYRQPALLGLIVLAAGFLAGIRRVGPDRVASAGPPSHPGEPSLAGARRFRPRSSAPSLNPGDPAR